MWCTSGVARLGHTGARALATRGCAPPVQVSSELSALKVPLSIANRAVKSLQIERCSIATFIRKITGHVSSPYANLLYKYTALRYGLRTVLGGCNILGEHSPDLPNTSALGAEVCLKVVSPCCALASAMCWLHHCGARSLSLANYDSHRETTEIEWWQILSSRVHGSLHDLALWL